MISKLWEWGSISQEDKIAKYGLEIILDDGEIEEFLGTNPELVRALAMNFICKHYYEENAIAKDYAKKE